MQKSWFIWWIVPWSGQGTWYGMKYMTDREVWREQFDIVYSNPGATLYRMRWNGEQWLYDTRSDLELQASGAAF